MFADYWRNNCLEPVHICICMPPVIQSQEQSNDSTIEDVTDTELSYEDRITDYSDDVSREDTLDTELSYRDGVTERSEVESDKTPDETEPNETEKRCVDKSDEDDQPPKKVSMSQDLFFLKRKWDWRLTKFLASPSYASSKFQPMKRNHAAVGSLCLKSPTEDSISNRDALLLPRSIFCWVYELACFTSTAQLSVICP